MSHDLSQIYAPEADTFLLLDAASAEMKPSDRVIEVGTGSGFIAATLARTGARVIATDINPHAVHYAWEEGIEVVRTDLLSGISGMFDLIVFNPPYLPTKPDERVNDWLEHALDGGVNGRAVIERFAADAARVLAPGGRILLLISELTGLPEVRDLFFRQGFRSEIVLKQAVEGENLYVLRIIRGE